MTAAPARFATPGLLVPRLAGIPSNVAQQAGGDTRVQLALGMVDAGIIPTSLLDVRPDPAALIASGFRAWLDTQDAPLIDRRFEFDVRLGDPAYFSEYESEGNEAFALSLLPTMAGYAAWNAAFAMLEPVDAQLPATVWHAFHDSVHGGYRGYDFHDAQEYELLMRDGMDEEDLAEYLKSREQGAQVTVPPCLGRRALGERAIAERSRRWPSEVRAIVEAAMSLSHAAKRARRVSPRGKAWAAYPLPCFVSTFEPGDGIEAAFDDESRHMYNEEPGPSVLVPISSCDAAGVRGAFREFALHLAVFRSAAALLDTIPAFESYAIKTEKGRPLAEILTEDDEGCTVPVGRGLGLGLGLGSESVPRTLFEIHRRAA